MAPENRKPQYLLMDFAVDSQIEVMASQENALSKAYPGISGAMLWEVVNSSGQQYVAFRDYPVVTSNLNAIGANDGGISFTILI